PKAEVMAERIAQINPACEVRALQVFYTGEEHEKLLGDADYIADAIDSVGPKVELIARSHGLKKPIISSLGMGNKLDPTRIEITDIAKTHTCPLARAVRVSLRKKGIRSGIPVVFSPEPVTGSGGRVPGSTAFVPPAAGLVMASWIVGQVCREV
ncbi:MAG: ThiF family adenylyltransferase, partial [Limnochordia bacterium]